MGLMRLGRVETRVLELEKAVDYYTNVMGLQETGRKDGKVYLKAWDEEDHHSLILTEADQAGLEHLAFKVRYEHELDHFEKQLEKHGLRVNRVSKGSRLGEGEAIRFILPSGHAMELYHEVERVGNGLKLNPHPVPDNLKGIAPPAIDHLLVTAEDVKEVTDLLMNVFDFHMSERIVSVDGEKLLATWLFRTNTPHDIAFITGPNGKLHHFAFSLGDWKDILQAADTLSRNDVVFDVTPTRHGITRGTTIYFFDPSGNRNEVFSGGYIPGPDFTPVTWTEDQLGRGIFYHSRELNERFSQALT